MSGHESNTPLLIDRLFEEFFERGLKYFFPFATFEPIGSSPDSHIGVVEGNTATSVLSLNWLGFQYAFKNKTPFMEHELKLLNSVSAVLTYHRGCFAAKPS